MMSRKEASSNSGFMSTGVSPRSSFMEYWRFERAFAFTIVNFSVEASNAKTSLGASSNALSRISLWFAGFCRSDTIEKFLLRILGCQFPLAGFLDRKPELFINTASQSLCRPSFLVANSQSEQQLSASCLAVSEGPLQPSPTGCLAPAAKVRIPPILLKNACLIDGGLADSILLRNGRIVDDGTEAGSAGCVVL